MPRKKYVRRRPRRRVVRRKKKTGRRKVGHRPLGGFPEKKTVTLKYSDYMTVDPGAGSGAATNYFFRALGCYDPDETGTGHQPMGFDEWSQIYQAYRVISSRIKVTFRPFDKDVIVGINEVENTVVQGDGLNLVEQKGAKSRLMLAAPAASRGTVLTHKCNAFQKFSYAALTNISAISALPVLERFWRIWAFSPTASVNPATQTVLVEVFYDVQFTDRKPMIQS